MFSPETFLNAVITQANDDKITPCPVGDFPATVVDLKPASGIIGKGERAGQPWARLDVTWEITDPNVKAVTNRDKTRVRQGIMLDLTTEGSLDLSPGVNIQMGKFRTALGLNEPGLPFSPTMALNRSARISVTHRIDERDGVTIQAEVRGVARM